MPLHGLFLASSHRHKNVAITYVHVNTHVHVDMLTGIFDRCWRQMGSAHDQCRYTFMGSKCTGVIDSGL